MVVNKRRVLRTPIIPLPLFILPSEKGDPMANALMTDIPFQAIESIELFVNKCRYSVAQVADQAQAKRPERKVYVVS